MCLGKRWAWEGGYMPSNHFRLLKKALALSISNRMSTFSSLDNKDFNINLICPQGINYNPCPEDCGGSVLLKGIISWTLNCVEQNGHLKILSDVFGEMVGVERVLVAFQSLLTLNKGTRTHLEIISEFAISHQFSLTY